MIEGFDRHRPRLLGLAYRMLGSAADAEDVVQDVYLRWQRTEPGSVMVPSAWLVKVTANLCLTCSMRRRGGGYGRLGRGCRSRCGPLTVRLARWRPPSSGTRFSFAFLMLAEWLTPAERVVFVLREAFGYRHREVAELVEMSESNCRQLHRRARERLDGARFAPSADTAGNRALVAQFLDASRGGDLAGLERMLAEDIVSVADGGDTRGVARRPVRGTWWGSPAATAARSRHPSAR